MIARRWKIEGRKKSQVFRDTRKVLLEASGLGEVRPPERRLGSWDDGGRAAGRSYAHHVLPDLALTSPSPCRSPFLSPSFHPPCHSVSPPFLLSFPPIFLLSQERVGPRGLIVASSASFSARPHSSSCPVRDTTDPQLPLLLQPRERPVYMAEHSWGIGDARRFLQLPGDPV
ncbi:hypothetical protein E2C01_013386 [Portunus trituberculatus]|uniref:Uncharacterized protein n=1 Tax=Portunus trituberculatus TaxID=210409 RepID=A0A5B7DH04_PORTR|nr:hypothetical protein [Portunus trituberculatus]